MSKTFTDVTLKWPFRLNDNINLIYLIRSLGPLILRGMISLSLIFGGAPSFAGSADEVGREKTFNPVGNIVLQDPQLQNNYASGISSSAGIELPIRLEFKAPPTPINKNEDAVSNDSRLSLEIQVVNSEQPSKFNFGDLKQFLRPDDKNVSYGGAFVKMENHLPVFEDIEEVSSLDNRNTFLSKYQKGTQISFIIVRAFISAGSVFVSMGGGQMLAPIIPPQFTYVAALVNTTPNQLALDKLSILGGVLTAGVFSGTLMAKNEKFVNWLNKSNIFFKLMKNIFISTAFVSAVRLASHLGHQLGYWETHRTFDPLPISELFNELSIIYSSVGMGLMTQNFWSLWLAEKEVEFEYRTKKEARPFEREEQKLLDRFKLDLMNCLNSAVLGTGSLLVGLGVGGKPLEFSLYGAGLLGAALWYRLLRKNKLRESSFIKSSGQICLSLFR